jgi:hypothetical protein
VKNNEHLIPSNKKYIKSTLLVYTSILAHRGIETKHRAEHIQIMVSAATTYHKRQFDFFQQAHSECSKQKLAHPNNHHVVTNKTSA